MMKKLLLSILLLSSFLTSQSAFSFEITHNKGTLTLDNPPERVVSYELSHLDTLTALGVNAVGVPKSSYKKALKQYQESPTVGTLFEPDYEALKTLNPDLIIAGGRSEAAIPELEKIAPTISFTNDPTHFLDSVQSSVHEIAKAWDKTAEGEMLIKELEENITQLHHLNQEKTGVFLFIINDMIIPHAPGDRFGYLEELVGLKPVLPPRTPEELNQPRPEPNSPEAKAMAEKRASELNTIISANPDWLIVLDRGAINDGEKTAEKTIANHPELSQLRAVKNNQVFYVDPNPWYVITGGINNLTTLTEQFLEAMSR